ncbi:MAG: hypothetical protein QOG93_1599 [Gaiellaceae bacterium]|nr:hypothetical protein [Gaiellaceae bacterium]
MAEDLVRSVHRQIDTRLRELRPAVEEYERLKLALDALSSVAAAEPGVRKRRTAVRPSASGHRSSASSRAVSVSEISWADLASVRTILLDESQQKELEDRLAKPAA